jgi:ABC-type multidrug transport system, ATPase component
MNTIDVKNVTKQYGSTTALRDVTTRFEGGCIYGLLGRNGAGKTTLLNLITNKVFPTGGEITIDGASVYENDAALSKVYCMTEKGFYPNSMTVKEIFRWTREFYPGMDTEYAYRLADLFALNIKKKEKTLSTGYMSIYKIIIALSCNAPILLLDEPVLGLDANFRDLFYRELIKNYTENPRTIVVSTHLIEEAAEVFEKVVIIKEGRIIMQDNVQNVLSRGYTVTGPQRLVDDFIQGRNVLGADLLGGIKSAYLLDALPQEGAPQGVEISKMRLQSLFIHLTNAGGNL